MRVWIVSAQLSLAALATAGMTAQAQATRSPRPIAHVTNCQVIDGDTLHCGSIRVRLVGIDAAELPGHCPKGRRCAEGDPYRQRDSLRNLAAGELTIIPLKLDKYGRIIARIRNARGDDLSCAMLAAGATYRADWDEDNIIARTCPSQASGSRRRQH